jgi:hypothetical protein
LFFARKSLTNTGRCAEALSWRRNHLLVLHFSGRFLLTAALRPRRIPSYRYYHHAVIPVNYNSQFRKIFEVTTYFKEPNSRFFPKAVVKFLLHRSCQLSMCYSWHKDSVIKKKKKGKAPLSSLYGAVSYKQHGLLGRYILYFGKY